jgi:uncharacterized protein (DUF433 family)
MTGIGTSTGGRHPEPPLHGWPLLVWQPGHDRHGDKVFTEDGRATVNDIVKAFRESQDSEAVARRFGTTTEHVLQAVAYGALAGQFGGG